MTYGYIPGRIRLSRPVIEISLPSGCVSAANGCLSAFRWRQQILEPACRLFTMNQPFASNVWWMLDVEWVHLGTWEGKGRRGKIS
jgi:hypothetical protein